MTIPTLQFDFHLEKTDLNNPVTFTNPVKAITTDDINNVFSCLQEVNNAIHAGFYVAGFISYEATYAFYDVKKTIESDQPLLWFGLFKEPIHDSIQHNQNTYSLSDWNMIVSKDNYEQRVNEILRLIANRKTEQVNYTVPFETAFSGDSYAYYEQLKLAQKANYSAYLQLEEFDILSVSPELFFSIEGGTVTVKPMKGTIQRGKTYEEDEKNRNWLKDSVKNKIENDLISELMYNELKTIADDLYYDERYSIEKYPTVYQMTTTIKGTLKPKMNAIHVLTSLFPCGSISGIPKQETIEIIANIEQQPRGVYCGAIGYFSPNGNAIFNVPIRTVTINKKQQVACYYAGGGITARSTPNEEYKEMITKTKVLTTFQKPFQLLETMLLEEGTLFLKNQHLNRLINSVKYFNIPISENELQNELGDIERLYPTESWRIRLLVDLDGNISKEAYPLEKTEQQHVLLAKQPINKENIFLYHKTTERSMFEEHRHLITDDLLDILLWNENGEITEFTIGNVVVEKNGELFTPPISSGLLPGTFRQHLLEQGEIKERKIYVDELNYFDSIWLINSVRKWVKVNLLINQ